MLFLKGTQRALVQYFIKQANPVYHVYTHTRPALVCLRARENLASLKLDPVGPPLGV